MNQELREHFGETNNYLRESGRLHRRGECCAGTLRMNLLGRVGGKGISGGGNSMSKATEMQRSMVKKKGGKGRLSQRPPESLPYGFQGHPILQAANLWVVT